MNAAVAMLGINVSLGPEMQGVVIGGALTIIGGVIAQLFIGRQQRLQFDRESKAAQNTRIAQWKREDELAQSRGRELVFERMWERRANAYDRLLLTLAGIRTNAQKAFQLAHLGKGDEATERMSQGLDGVKTGLSSLRTVNLYWNDRTIRAVAAYLDESQANAVKKVADPTSNEAVSDFTFPLIAATDALITTVRAEGREHLRDKDRSIANAFEDAVTTTSGK